MRVLHLIGEMTTGGAESLVVEMAKRGSDHLWVVGVASAGGIRADRVHDAGHATVYTVPLARRRPLGVLRAIRSTVSAITDFNPDVILAHNVSVTLVAGLSTRLPCRQRIPIVTVFHGVAESDYRRSARILSLFSDHVVTVSRAIARRLNQSGLRTTNVTVIPNAITPPALIDQAQAKQEIGVPDVPIALSLARMVEQKRHDVLLRAWKQVPGPALLLLAGDGELRPQHEELAQKLGISDRVRFLGVRSDVPRLLSACSLTALSSDWEGLPIAVLESMAAGKPVVSTDVDGVSEAIGDGAGLLVPRRDPKKFAAAVSALLYDEQARELASQAALRIVREHHAPDAMMSAYDALLRGLVRNLKPPCSVEIGRSAQ
jgi:glycosyltransferase involved in cell wall biosynthesis